MKKLVLLALPFALAACGGEPAPQPTETAAPTPTETTATLLPPDQAQFSEMFAAACPEAKKVAVSECKRDGFGSEDLLCEFGLGEDNYPRNQVKLSPADGKWVFSDAENTCKNLK